MRAYCNLIRVIILVFIVLGADGKCNAANISDFHLNNPLSFAFPGSSWATPVAQFESYTDSTGFGQEVVPIGGGNPTVSGGAGVLGLNLNLSGNDALQLTARLLSGNQAVLIQVLLDDADGTILRFSYATSNFNTSTFSSATVRFADATTTVAGSTPGFDMSHVTFYEVQGDFFDGGGTAAFRAQFNDLSAVSTTPEPSPGLLAMIGLSLVFALRPILPTRKWSTFVPPGDVL